MATIFMTDIPWQVILIGAAALFIIAYLASVVKSEKRLRDFPGPWPARFTNLWYAKLVMSGSLDTGTAALFEKYGNL